MFLHKLNVKRLQLVSCDRVYLLLKLFHVYRRSALNCSKLPGALPDLLKGAKIGKKRAAV